MIRVRRSNQNPILIPNKDNDWESKAVFNGSVARKGDLYYMVYRAMSHSQFHAGKNMDLSTIGVAESSDGIHFHNRRHFLHPDQPWDQFGCEDPRVTYLNGNYYILYTGLSDFPPGAEHITVGVAVTEDFENIKARRHVTHFNSKAAALFPALVNRKVTMILSVNTDNPPVKTAIIQFDRIDELWNESFWKEWIKGLDKHAIDFRRSSDDHVEVGAAPIKTEMGWLLIYAYIKNYFKQQAIFGIEAALLDHDDPRKIIGRTREPLLVPREYYELYGEVPNIVFPSGSLIEGDQLVIYYGAADTSICRAEVNLNLLLTAMTAKDHKAGFAYLTRFEENPLISPKPDHEWEASNTFNPAAIYLDDKIHILYRSMSKQGVSTVGYAVTSDGHTILERLPEPVYVPREPFETKDSAGNSGCEDPRLTLIDGRIYMCYAAYDGINPPRVALTSISVEDFRVRKWEWERPVLISPPGMMDKNTCILPEKVRDRYVFFHRLDNYIWVDYRETLDFSDGDWLEGTTILRPRINKWDSLKIGICCPPIRTDYGWVLLYHGLSKFDGQYRVGAALLDLYDLDNVLCRLDHPLLEPESSYEMSGERPGTVFPCGAIVTGDTLYVYYGGGDTYLCGAYMSFGRLLKAMTME